jgi:hypothetical protein
LEKIHKADCKARAKMTFFAEKCFLSRHFGTSIRNIFYLCSRKSAIKQKPEE